VTTHITIRTGTELPTIQLPWQAYNHSTDAWEDVDTTGQSFILRVALADTPGTTILEQTAAITGGDGIVTLAQAARLAIGALNTSNTETKVYKGVLIADPAGDPRPYDELSIAVEPAMQDIP
jgi:hypothetical protein